MALRAIWEAMLGRSKAGDAASDREFYERLAAFKSVVDSNTESLRRDHEELNAKLDAHSEKLNQIFEDLNRDK